MKELFAGFFADVLTEVFGMFDALMLTILGSAMRIETMLDATLGAFITAETIANTYAYIYTFACTLLVLKLIFKGFKIYVLWRDGDADSSPQDMLIGLGQAIVTIIAFPALYNIMCDVTLDLATGIMGGFGISGSSISFDFKELSNLGIVILILVLVYVIMVLILYVKLVGRGFELLVMRLGIPIACMGLLDSDMGVFRGYMQTIIKALFTSMIQVTLLSMSVRLLSSLQLPNIILGIAAIATAMSTPVLMQQMLVASGGGGGITNKVYSGARVIQAVKGLSGGG